MKVIDLLNKIANKEVVPKKIKINNNEFRLVDKYTPEGDYDYQDQNNQYFIEYLNEYNYITEYLNREVEIIVDKEIEIKQEYTSKGKLHDYLYYEGNKYQLSLPQLLLFKEIEKIKKELEKIKEEGK